MVRIVDNQVSNFDSQPILVTGGPGTGKSTVIKGITNKINSDNAFWLETTGTAYFLICGSTCHSKLYLTGNKPYFDISGILLDNLQNTLPGINVVVIEKVSIMGEKRIDMIDKRLSQASTNYGVLFGGFLFILVGNFSSFHR